VTETATGQTLAVLEAQARERLLACARLMESGVRIIDPATTYVAPGVRVGEGTEIRPNTTIGAGSVIGSGCVIGPNSVISESSIGDRCTVMASVLEGAVLEDGVEVGPFSHLRPGVHLEPDVHVGNFVEVKASRLGRGTKVGHFSYLGDAQVGERVNIGAGTVTCNYDGDKKSITTIGDDAFVGSDTMLVAPVTLGRGARTGAGAVVTEDVPDGATVAGVPARSLAGRTRRRVRPDNQVKKGG
jgi:bifunctional UDP-N-acetylglucosamine pyrophosphorylase/glucosamine-1-phosphate N-acetyltransferase